MFNKILIANRGEIAVRVIRACRELGIKTVAVHSTADRDSLHVRFADEAVCIGPAEARRSYLNIPAIISAAEVTNADAIHVGYGFLSENAKFAEICEACQIKFIGPKPFAIEAMGDKARAREMMIKAKVPVIPGSEGVLRDTDEAARIAEEIGYPVILKAAGGGGGRGMRIVQEKEAFDQSFKTVQSEAEAAFGNRDIYIEKYLEEPRHVEVQILGDSHGNVIHLGTRDCSIQYRHQKLIEEAPCASLPQEIIKKMCDTAVKIGKAVDYENAGTIEFLADKNNNFYFIEMNTRIQVEHPVTEMVTGIDLVKEQIRIAAGKPLSVKQSDIRIYGHSIECRVNAASPDTFMPSPGRITNLNLPGGPGVRVDSAIFVNYVVQPYYDSMIGKLIVHGHDRADAVAKMKRALGEFHIEGIKTTIAFHQKVMDSPVFISGKFTTHFLKNFNAG